MHLPLALTLSCVLLAACGGSTPSAEEAEPLPDANDPAYAASFDGTMDARVSTSAGAEGGLVVLWPRVVTSAGVDAAAEAGEVQAHLQAIAQRAAGGRPVDVRPEPQRVCPRTGCLGPSAGAVLLRTDGGCAVVATVGSAGQTPSRLLPWAGEVELRKTQVPFREPPEQHVRVIDFVPCSDLGTALAAGEPAIEEALREAIGE